MLPLRDSQLIHYFFLPFSVASPRPGWLEIHYVIPEFGVNPEFHSEDSLIPGTAGLKTTNDA